MAFSFKQTILFVLFVIIFLASDVSSLRHDEAECLALFQFKQTFLHQPSASFDVGWFHKLDSWRKIPINATDRDDFRSDCCFWDGVVCSKEGHVIGLDLSQSSIFGPIKSNSTLFNLVHLRMLNLSMNDFVGSQIPSEIARLKQLRILDLSDSGFSGQIPSEMSQLVQLTRLNLSRNPLRLQSPSLKYLLQNMTSLEVLDLLGVDISSSVPRFLANFSSLRHINLQGCQLQDEFPSAIFQLPKLHVICLRYNTKLFGSLPEFHNNSLLEYLNLYGTGFGGTIPESIGKLNNLYLLSFGNCSFSGRIPASLSNLTQLIYFDLSQNPLQSPNLEYMLQNMTRLEVLDLLGVDISSSVPRFLANFSSLWYINLEDCQLQDEFPSAIFQLPKLNTLWLGYNTKLVGSLPEFHNSSLLEYLNLFETGFGGTIPESIGKLNHLDILFLGFCSFSGRIPGSLSNLTQLTSLDLSSNELTGLVPSLESLSKLNILVLSSNDFEKGRMFNWISRLTTLKELYVDKTNIHEEIPPSIANLTNLYVAFMSGNFISGQIPSSFMNLTKLTRLHLLGNQLQGPMSTAFSNFKSLVYLDLRYNKFDSKVDLDSFVGLNKLELLTLAFNRISFTGTNNYSDGILPELKGLDLQSCNLKEFPAFLCFQKKLRVLYLNNNKIEGLLPKCIWNTSQETLQLIDLSNNFITGFHPHPHFLPWVYMKVFDVSNNQVKGRIPIPPPTTILYDVSNNNLIGEIPPLICEVKSLQYLDLSFNHMIGTLPSCLGNLSKSLWVLNLNRNNFHGPMVNTFGPHGSSLKRIDLSDNQFTGEVPKSLANCTNLQFISLGNNSFDGRFPFWMGNLTKLQVLILGSNKLFGEIQGQSTISSQFLKLQILDLSDNSFIGQLHDTFFQNWNAMKSTHFGKSFAMGFINSLNISVDNVNMINKEYQYSMTLTNKGAKREYKEILNIFVAMDLSCNNFVGEIPQSLQDLQGLQSLNLSNNHLTGHILPSLGNLKNLESLDLSHNKLSGEVPQQLVQLGFLEIWNVSFNHLDGRIPQGKQFDTFDNSSYVGNPGLCGLPLSNDCVSSKAAIPLPTRTGYESFIPSERIDWIIVFLGVGSGLTIGIVFGNILYARYSDWFVERFGFMKERWVRPLSDRRRN